MFGRDAKLSHLRTSGSSAFVHKEGILGKTSERAWKGVLVGYDEESPFYRIYRPATRQVIKTRNVRFIEAPTGIINIQPATCQELDTQESAQAGNNQARRRGLRTWIHGTMVSGTRNPQRERYRQDTTDNIGADTTTTGQHSRVTRSQSAQGKSSVQQYVGQDAKEQRELNKLAPYLHDASDSDNDHNHDLDAEEIAGWDLNTGSGIPATKAEPTLPHAIPIPWNY